MRKIILVLVLLFTASAACRKREEKPDVLLITIDTLRSDHLGACEYHQGRTPHLDSLARRGFLFSDVVSPVPLTLPAHASILTGTYPIFHGVRDNGTFKLAAGQTTLAEVLKSRGYRTGAIIAAFVLDRRFGLEQGFDEYDDHLGGSPASGFSHYQEIPAARVTEKAVAWLKKVDGPFFLWVHYFDPHADYQPPEPFQSRFADQPYDGEIAYVDQEIGRLMDALREQDSLSRTLLVVTSDHGEGLGEHGEPTHGLLAYQSTLRVPLILHGSGIPTGSSSQTASLVDIFPTILRLLDIPEPPVVQGRDLSAFFQGQSDLHPLFYFETLAPQLNLGWSPLQGIRNGRYKYIHAPRPELYDLAADPEERNNLVRELSPEAEKLELKLREIEQRFASRPRGGNRPPALEQSAWEAIQSLGYGGGGGGEGDQRARLDPKEMLPMLELLARSESQIRQSLLPEAEKTLQDIIKLDPDNPVAWERLVVVYRLRGDLEKALAALEKKICLKPGQPQSYLIKAEILRQQGRLGEAGKAVQSGLSLDSSDSGLWVMQGKILNLQGKLSDAYQAFQKAIEIDPDYLPAQVNLADYYCRRRDWTAAEKILRRLAQTDPGNPDVRYNLGVFFLTRGDLDHARAEFGEALRLDSSHQLTRQKLKEMEK